MRALTLRASVRMEPVKPFSVEVNVPMVAIVVVLFSCSGRAHRDLDSCQKTGDDRTAPNRAAMNWGAASRRFDSGRGARCSLPGSEICGLTLRDDDRGAGGLRAAMPPRARSRGGGTTEAKGSGQG